ncbi:MAG: FtsW/RodA/SpoVE family cell cycle protein [Tidjanibacter sp.]|nr:FtsW/RodA/SpoVE family cell cycle protein [Tidjanibacter sp.]
MDENRDNGKRNKILNLLFGGDKALWVVVIALLIISVFVSYSSMAYKESISSTAQLINQLKLVGLGLVACYLVQLFKYQTYRRWTKFFFWIALGLTIYMLVAGDVVHGTTVRRNITIFGFSFQPFEMLKITIVLMLADALSRRHKIIDKESMVPSLSISEWRTNKEKNLDILFKHTLPLLLPVILSCLVTIRTSNSTTAIIVMVCGIMLFLGRMQKKDLGKLVILGSIVLAIILIFMGGRTDTGQSRIAKFEGNMLVAYEDPDRPGFYHNPNEMPQSMHAKQAVAAGKIIGRGPGMSTHRSVLEEAESDMAYSFLIEEYGLIGGLVVLLLYLTLFYRAIEIFKRCGTAFPSLMVLGLAMMITCQAIIHMMVSVSLMPITGQQLPLISNGGSSLIFTMASLGMILKVSRQVEEKTIDASKDETMFEKQ